MRKVEPFKIPEAIKSNKNIVKKPQTLPALLPSGKKCITPKPPAIITPNTHKLTRAPPSLSAMTPPAGRANAPNNGPIKAYLVGSTSANSIFDNSGNPAAKPIKLPKAPRYNQHINQVWERLKITT